MVIHFVGSMGNAYPIRPLPCFQMAIISSMGLFVDNTTRQQLNIIPGRDLLDSTIRYSKCRILKRISVKRYILSFVRIMLLVQMNKILLPLNLLSTRYRGTTSLMLVTSEPITVIVSKKMACQDMTLSWVGINQTSRPTKSVRFGIKPIINKLLRLIRQSLKGSRRMISAFPVIGFLAEAV
ncbi:unknown [Dialister sp. CAG:588]|nr:unknown [Dialister sp. CAG:588]